MKEFIEKLIGRLEEEKSLVPYNRLLDTIEDKPKEVGQLMTYQRVIEIVNQLAEEYNNSNDSMEIQIAKNYAKWLTKCGVNITEKWETATAQAYALNEAYMRGMQDERDRFAELQEEYNNDFCEWKISEYGDYWKPNCCDDVYYLLGVRKFEFCPYCGKKIKIAPYQPKGE